MSRLRVVMALVLLAVALAIVFALARSQDSSAAAGHDPDAAAARASGAAPGSDLIAEREQALQEARAQGRFGQAVARTTRPAPGWVGSRLLNAKTDDWEPAVAADPHHPYLYLLTTRYGAPKACVRCPSPFLALTVSHDGGRTWSAQRQLCICPGHPAQYDPTIEVVPNSGIVYAAFLNATPGNSFSTAFMKSSDHGATWSAPVKVYGKVAWTDKPEITASRSGKDVYVSWNGPSNGDLYVGQSHDYGVTWTQQKLTTSKRYYYAYDARVLADGTVMFSESSLLYAGPNGVHGRVWHHVIFSLNHGRSWNNVVVAKVPVGQKCVAAGCSPDFYLGQTSVVEDGKGRLVFAYEGPVRRYGPQRVYVSRSDNGGRTWTPGMPLSVPGENATGPRLGSSGNGGDVRIWYMQTAHGDDPNAWNVWYRRSHDGGRRWLKPVRISDAPPGAAGYVHRFGFGEIYGDYGEVAVTNHGETFAAWGEGFSYNGPGGTWFNIGR
ncbi:MAG TPA: sialidase family protein [Gaiellales bacterium]|nr:sialidase family protein [Gaiellales bacterium]